MTEIDTALVRRLQAQDPAALIELGQHFRARIYSFSLRFLRNHQDAEEITQDVLLTAWRKIGQFRGDASLLGWLLCIARNRALNLWHHRRRRKDIGALSLDTPPADCASLHDQLVGDGPTVHRLAELAEFQEHLTAIVAQLRENERQIMILCLEGKTYKQMAEIIGLDFGTVKSRLARARYRLRLLLEARDPALCDLRPEHVA